MWKPQIVPKAPDGGWGWIAAIGAGIVYFQAGGLPLSFSLIFQEVKDRFGGTASQTTGIYVVSVACNMLTAPLASALCKRFSCRTVGMAGGILATVGACVTANATSLATLYFGYGVIMGLGLCGCAVACFITMNIFFHKKKARAISLASSMDGVGGLILPMLLTLMFQVGGFPAAMYAVACICAHLVVAGALFRPIRIVPPKSLTNGVTKPQAAPNPNGYVHYASGDTSINPDNAHRVSSADLKASVVGLDSISIYYDAEDGLNRTPIIKTKNSQIHNGAVTRMDKAHSISQYSLPKLKKPWSTNDEEGRNNLIGNKENGHIANGSASAFDKIKSISQYELIKCKPASAIAVPVRYKCIESYEKDEGDAQADSSKQQPEALKTTSQPEALQENLSVLTMVKQTFRSYFDVTLFGRPRFTCITFAIGGMSVAIGVANLFLAIYAKERGFTGAETALLLSIRSGVFIIYKPMSGLVFDHDQAVPYHAELYAVLGICGGIATFLAPLATNFPTVLVTWLVTSFFIAWLVAQEPVVISATVPMGKFPTALGLARFVRGSFSLIGNLCAGLIVDALHSYDAAYRFGGAVLFATSLLLLVVSFVLRRRERAREERSTKPDPIKA